MTDNAEQGEQPSDPVKRAGVGAGAVPDDYADGVAEEEFAQQGRVGDPRGAAPRQGDTDAPPGEERTPLADTDADQARMHNVNPWGTGDELPLATPGADREDGGAT